MNGIGKQALFYRGYLTNGRSLAPVTVLLATAITLWLAIYLVGVVGNAIRNTDAAQGACALLLHNPQTTGPLNWRAVRREGLSGSG